MKAAAIDTKQVGLSNQTEQRSLNAAALVDAHGDNLFRYALSRLRDEAAAEDVVQETLVVALQKSEDFAGKSSARTWLTGILKHKIIDHFRRVSREVNFSINDAETTERFFDEAGTWNSDFAPARWAAASDVLFEQKEFMAVLEKCIAELPLNLAIVFTLREIEDLDSAEICKILNISASNFSVMMHRARLRLRQALQEKWFVKESLRVKMQQNKTFELCREEYKSRMSKYPLSERSLRPEAPTDLECDDLSY